MIYGFALAAIIWLILISTVTFLLWLRPHGYFSRRIHLGDASPAFDRFVLLSAISGVLLFISCFLLGSWLSMMELKGLVWM